MKLLLEMEKTNKKGLQLNTIIQHICMVSLSKSENV